MVHTGGHTDTVEHERGRPVASGKEPLAVVHTGESYKEKQVQQRMSHKLWVGVAVEVADQREVPQPSGHTPRGRGHCRGQACHTQGRLSLLEPVELHMNYIA